MKVASGIPLSFRFAALTKWKELQLSETRTTSQDPAENKQTRRSASKIKMRVHACSREWG